MQGVVAGDDSPESARAVRMRVSARLSARAWPVSMTIGHRGFGSWCRRRCGWRDRWHGSNVGFRTQAVIAGKLERTSPPAWLDTLPAMSRAVEHDAVMAALVRRVRRLWPAIGTVWPEVVVLDASAMVDLLTGRGQLRGPPITDDSPVTNRIHFEPVDAGRKGDQ